MREAWAVIVDKKLGETVRKLLYKSSLLVGNLKIKQVNDKIAFPIYNPKIVENILIKKGINFEIQRLMFNETRAKMGRLPGPVRSYVIIGNIAVFSKTSGISIDNYKRAARELLISNRRLVSAWLKIRTIGNERLPELMHLAGDKITRTIAKEYGIKIAVDIAKAYYNPKLAFEHRRIAEEVDDNEIILDLFSGVGGFTIHIATTRRATIIANDINPEAIKLAKETFNLNKNKIKSKIILVQGDAKALDHIFKPIFKRIILNLPSRSHEYVTTACNLATYKSIMHYYILGESCNHVKALLQERFNGAPCSVESMDCRRVIDYSPRLSIYAVDLVARK